MRAHSLRRFFPRVLAATAVLSLTLAAAGVSGVAADLPGGVEAPAWIHETLYEMTFSSRGDLRRSVPGGRNEFEIFEVNRMGAVTGEDYQFAAQPWSRAFWERATGQTGKTPEEVDQAYRAYVRENADIALGRLALARILDNEAMKRKIEPYALPSRVEYVVRSVLLRNAADTGKFETVEYVERDYLGNEVARRREFKNPAAVNVIENEELYRSLKSVYGSKPINLNINWKYDEFGMGRYLAIAVPSYMQKLQWPAVKIKFSALPETFAAFERGVKTQLDDVARVLRRQLVWQQLLTERQATMQMDLFFAMRSDRVQKLYDTMKDRLFSVQEVRATGTLVTISGSRAAEASTRLEAILARIEKEQMDALFPQGGSAPRTPEEQKARIDAVNAARAASSERALSELLSEYSAAVAEGASVLSVSRTPVSAFDDGTGQDDETPGSGATALERLLVNPAFAGAALLPRMDVTDPAKTSGAIELLVLKSFEPGAVKALPVSDPRVQAAIRQGLQQKIQGRHFRDLAFKLMRENGLSRVRAFCGDAAWPCPSTDVARLVEVLFPETLYPGESLGFDGPGRPKSSSLLEPGLLEKVMSISIERFAPVFQMPNHPY